MKCHDLLSFLVICCLQKGNLKQASLSSSFTLFFFSLLPRRRFHRSRVQAASISPRFTFLFCLFSTLFHLRSFFQKKLAAQCTRGVCNFFRKMANLRSLKCRNLSKKSDFFSKFSSLRTRTLLNTFFFYKTTLFVTRRKDQNVKETVP